MAQSKGFFGLRKGSTKSLTFSTLRGKQITKDRVFGGANPQTLTQARQRSKVATYTQLWKVVSPICDHAFEGLSQGDANRRAFMSANLKLNDQMVIPKGGKDAILTKFVVSDGSLPPIVVNENNKPLNISFPNDVDALPGIALKRDYYEMLLEDNPILREGDQLTFLTIYDQEVNINYLDHTVSGASLRFDRMIIPYVNSDVSEKDYVDPNNGTIVAGGTEEALQIEFTNSAFRINTDTNTVTLVSGETNNNKYGQVIGIILSRFVNGKWRRSPCTINTYNLTGFNIRINQQFLLSYTKSYNSDSPLYLNEGEDL